MEDPLRSLFMPLTLGVGFAKISSYFLSSTFVPIMCVYLLKHTGGTAARRSPASSTGSSRSIARLVEWFVGHRWLVVLAYLAACGLVIGLLGLQVGTELFPQVDAGEFVLRFRPPPGSSYELTREMGIKCLQEIEHEAGKDNVAITMGFVGQVAPNFGIDNMVLFMRGPDDGWLRVKLKEDSGIVLDEFRERLRKVFPEQGRVPWMARRLETGGLASGEAQQQAKKCSFGFEPGDIVSQVMSFGASKPIAIRVVGTDYDEVRKHAEKIAGEMRRIPISATSASSRRSITRRSRSRSTARWPG